MGHLQAWAPAALLLALLPCVASVAIGTAASRSSLRQSSKAGQETSSCDCARCLGERKNEGGDGTVAFQCLPSSSGLQDCRQSGKPTSWAVQSVEILSYDRFCLYTCKPKMSNRIEATVPCQRLTVEEIKLQVQDASWNGQEMVYEAHPFTHVSPISRLVGEGHVVMSAAGSAAVKSGDPVGVIKSAFASVRDDEKKSIAVGGADPFELPKAAMAPPLCVCHCKGDYVDRLRTKEKGPHDVYPAPKVKPYASSTDAVLGLDAEPQAPPLPPPPPPPLPPPAMPMGMGPMKAELPTIPEAPPEVTAPLDLPYLRSAAAGTAPTVALARRDAAPAAALSFLQEEAAPIACNCIC